MVDMPVIPPWQTYPQGAWDGGYPPAQVSLLPPVSPAMMPQPQQAPPQQSAAQMPVQAPVQSMAAPAAAPQQAPAQGGLLGSFGKGLSDLYSQHGNMMLGLSSGLMSRDPNNVSTAFSNAAQGALIDAKVSDQQEQKKKQRQQEEALRNILGPDLAGALGNEKGAEYLAQQRLNEAKPNLTDTTRDLMAAGLRPGTPEFASAMKQKLLGNPDNTLAVKGYRQNSDGSMSYIPGGPADPNNPSAQRIPAGYMKGPNGTLTYIPGGPGDPASKVPAEVKARMALGTNFLDRYGGIRNRVQENAQSFPMLRGANNAGALGEDFRQIDGGIDAVRRGLTGAGMPAAEAEEYVRRYRPDPTDTAATAASKLDNLQRDVAQQYRNIFGQDYQPKNVGLPKPKTAEEVAKLPPGTMFEAPDGQIKIVPPKGRPGG